MSLQASSDSRCPQQHQPRGCSNANFNLRRFGRPCSKPCTCTALSLKRDVALVQEAEKRLRDIVTGKRPSSALTVNGTAARKMGGKQRQQLFYFTVSRPPCCPHDSVVPHLP